jgi:hypothetical protein
MFEPLLAGMRGTENLCLHSSPSIGTQTVHPRRHNHAKGRGRNRRGPGEHRQGCPIASMKQRDYRAFRSHLELPVSTSSSLVERTHSARLLCFVLQLSCAYQVGLLWTSYPSSQMVLFFALRTRRRVLEIALVALLVSMCIHPASALCDYDTCVKCESATGYKWCAGTCHNWFGCAHGEQCRQ